MATNLNNSALINEKSAAHRTMFENIQCNILKAVGRERAAFLFLNFTADRDGSRRFLGSIRPFIKSMQDQIGAKERYVKAKQAKQALPDELMGALFISAEGYTHLGFDPGSFPRADSFNRGMKSQNSGSFDKLLNKDNKDPKVADWEPGFQNAIHAMIMLTADNDSTIDSAKAQVIALASDVATVVIQQTGCVVRENNDPEKEPLEHFGYRDGISQPLFFADDVAEIAADNWDPSAELALVLTEDPFAKGGEDSFGSFFVFRKLKQDVPAFNEAVVALSAELGLNNPDLAGAMIVGRFKNGTPLTLSGIPNADVPQNNFNFDKDNGDKCPMHSHIRKSNPRGTTPLTSLRSERTRRIARRGIPYGKQGSNDVGLLFMCYQSDIAHQFEFIQRTWIDNPNFPRNLISAGTGDDPLIGQDREKHAKQKWPTKYGGSERKSYSFEAFVTLQGGEYFYAPSMTFLRNL